MTFGQKALLGTLIPFFLLLGIVVTASYQPLEFLEAQVFSKMKKETVTIPPSTLEPVELIFVGDIMLDRYIRTVAKRRGEDFLLHDSVRAVFQEADVVIGNLEGPITDEASKSETSRVGEAANYHFTFPATSAEFLRQNNITLVNIGNNHILNFGEEGVEKTKMYLQTAEINYFGSPLLQDERVKYQEIKEVEIAFVTYNEFVSKGKEKALEDIKRARSRADLIILYTHWGTEYVGVEEDTRDLAHQFIEAGVDLIIGSHPHVIQENEEYQGKRIYYSLGNFIFDQYFSPETKEGLLVKAIFDPAKKQFSFEEKRVLLTPNGQTNLAP